MGLVQFESEDEHSWETISNFRGEEEECTLTIKSSL